MLETNVKAYSSKNETLFVFSFCLAICFIGFLRFLQNDVADEQQLKPYQKFINELSSAQKYLFETMVYSTSEVTLLYDDTGFWPETFVLEEEGVLPFAHNLLPNQSYKFTWLAFQHGSWVDYWGTNTDLSTTLLLRIIDLHSGYHPHPHPGVDYDPNKNTASQIWYYPQSNRNYPGERLPEAGWTWLLARNDLLLRKKENEK